MVNRSEMRSRGAGNGSCGLRLRAIQIDGQSQLTAPGVLCRRTVGLGRLQARNRARVTIVEERIFDTVFVLDLRILRNQKGRCFPFVYMRQKMLTTKRSDDQSMSNRIESSNPRRSLIITGPLATSWPWTHSTVKRTSGRRRLAALYILPEERKICIFRSTLVIFDVSNGMGVGFRNADILNSFLLKYEKYEKCYEYFRKRFNN